MVVLAIIITLLVQSTRGRPEDSYQLIDNLENSYINPDDISDLDEMEVRQRSGGLELFNRPDTDDYGEDFARPTRSGSAEKSDHFIRFGRSRQDFLRFGRNPRHTVRDGSSNYLRFGRSIGDEKGRSKRETEYQRMSDLSNFLRFGRNSNFLRFGRNAPFMAYTLSMKNNALPLMQVLTEILNTLKKQNSKCGDNTV